ncbi:MAG: radical SAM protein [Candidatus Rokubacteria bacterium]|nr:radical SAM protein [Candidatus Rokubacteria bacterium]
MINTESAPSVAFSGLDVLWIQLTGTWCNLACTHCLNASGPRDPWLKPLDATIVRQAIDEGEALGAREIYLTGGEPFLHPEVLPLLERALAAAPTTVLTNGTTITPAVPSAPGAPGKAGHVRVWKPMSRRAPPAAPPRPGPRRTPFRLCSPRVRARARRAADAWLRPRLSGRGMRAGWIVGGLWGDLRVFVASRSWGASALHDPPGPRPVPMRRGRAAVGGGRPTLEERGGDAQGGHDPGLRVDPHAHHPGGADEDR